jgi:competence protein ComEC
VHSLDVMILTHAQQDHQGGLAEVLEAMPVRILLDGGGNDDLHDRILALARSRGTQVVAARRGTVLRIGRLRITVLSPSPSTAVGGDPNQRSVVALASYGGLDVFLPADAESDVTAALDLPDVELLKVAHHGSADAGLARLLERLSPEVAVIEVGSHNRYGHPHRDTLATLESSIPTVLRTDRDGNVRVALEERRLKISTER